MWSALIRVGARYAFFRRWKNTLIFIGGVALCAITAFLIDSEKYLSAWFVGAFAAFVMGLLGTQYLRERREIRERERQRLEKLEKRIAAAEARSEKIDKVRATAAGMAKGVGGRAAGFVKVAKTGFSGARDKLGTWRKKSGES